MLRRQPFIFLVILMSCTASSHSAMTDSGEEYVYTQVLAVDLWTPVIKYRETSLTSPLPKSVVSQDFGRSAWQMHGFTRAYKEVHKVCSQSKELCQDCSWWSIASVTS